MLPDPSEQSDLLRRLLDHDQQIETLDGEIKAAAVELREMRKRRKEAVAARAKLSSEIRRPTPILGVEPETLALTMTEAAKAQRATDSRGAKPKGWKP